MQDPAGKPPPAETPSKQSEEVVTAAPVELNDKAPDESAAAPVEDPLDEAFERAYAAKIAADEAEEADVAASGADQPPSVGAESAGEPLVGCYNQVQQRGFVRNLSASVEVCR